MIHSMDQAENHIEIIVDTAYVAAQSSPEHNQYVFSYTITIENVGARAAKLIDRHWIITDANGKVEEVHGEGVVGEQPYLRPGEAFRYTSGAVLETPIGCMQGQYGMLTDDNELFRATIPVFSLSMPNSLH